MIKFRPKHWNYENQGNFLHVLHAVCLTHCFNSPKLMQIWTLPTSSGIHPKKAVNISVLCHRWHHCVVSTLLKQLISILLRIKNKYTTSSPEASEHLHQRGTVQLLLPNAQWQMSSRKTNHLTSKLIEDSFSVLDSSKWLIFLYLFSFVGGLLFSGRQKVE